MGLHSWKYCDSKGRMRCGVYKKSYLLVPKEFGGGHIVEYCYNGYSSMGGHDVFETVALWNREYLTRENVAVPECNRTGSKCPSWYSKEEWDRIAPKLDAADVVRYEEDCRRIEDFASGKPDEYMQEKYGEDYLRYIGIDIACNDEDNANLKYPIKIAEKASSVYEECKPSLRDPMQGCD